MGYIKSAFPDFHNEIEESSSKRVFLEYKCDYAIKCYKKVGFSKTDKPIEFVRVGSDEWETIEMEKLPTH